MTGWAPVGTGELGDTTGAGATATGWAGMAPDVILAGICSCPGADADGAATGALPATGTGAAGVDACSLLSPQADNISAEKMITHPDCFMIYLSNPENGLPELLRPNSAE